MVGLVEARLPVVGLVEARLPVVGLVGTKVPLVGLVGIQVPLAEIFAARSGHQMRIDLFHVKHQPVASVCLPCAIGEGHFPGRFT
ncbi:hypothetical protein [Cryobacterium arcticum]|uniref:Uncharacterized protein n=1 Tax=Cryobacterium arcticum TaxID=670052 RepID=A0A317ZY01_9MICO|nr:hypothetical protein [Cryobacterium arcticum]PXA72209.1 hypothetical protein CTB96_04780 [Cryobacterium arcticum]